MKEELEDKLFKTFPTLYEGKDLSLMESLMGFGFECGDGWFGIIWQLSEELSEKYPEVRAVQVKEKFGGLRFYIAGGSAEVYEVIDAALIESSKVCELCEEGELCQRGSWVKTLCFRCRINNDYERYGGEEYE